MPIVICCSDADRAALADIAAALDADGNAVTFVEGVVEDPKRLAPVIAAHDRQGLYVLCRSKGLDRATVEEMREILLAEQVPFSRTLTVAASRPSMVAERIRSSLGRVRKATQARAAARSSAAPVKTEPAESPTVNLGPAPGTDDGPTLQGLETPDTGVIRAEQTGAMPEPAPPSSPSGLPPISTRGGPPPPPPAPPPSTSEDSVVAPLPSASSVELRRRKPEPGDDSLAQMASSISDIDLSDLDYGDTSIGRAPEDPGSAPRVETVVTPAEALIQGNTVRARPPEADHMDPGGVTDPLASASIALPPRPPSPPPLSPPPLPPTSPAPAPAHSSPAMSPSPSASPSVSTAAAAGVSAPGIPRVAWLAGGGVALGLMALAIVCAVREPDSDEDAKTVASKDDAPKSKASNASADDEDQPDDGDEDTTPAAPADDVLMLDGGDAPPSVVLAAIQRRNVRALDILLVQAKSAGVLEYQDAQKYCRTLEIDALADWRLPDIGELHSIGAADMLDSRTAYWSSTPGDTFGDAHLAFVPRRSRVINGADKADVLCVRGDRASS